MEDDFVQGKRNPALKREVLKHGLSINEVAAERDGGRGQASTFTLSQRKRAFMEQTIGADRSI